MKLKCNPEFHRIAVAINVVLCGFIYQALKAYYETNQSDTDKLINAFSNIGKQATTIKGSVNTIFNNVNTIKGQLQTKFDILNEIWANLLPNLEKEVGKSVDKVLPPKSNIVFPTKEANAAGPVNDFINGLRSDTKSALTDSIQSVNIMAVAAGNEFLKLITPPDLRPIYSELFSVNEYTNVYNNTSKVIEDASTKDDFGYSTAAFVASKLSNISYFYIYCFCFYISIPILYPVYKVITPIINRFIDSFDKFIIEADIGRDIFTAFFATAVVGLSLWSIISSYNKQDDD